MDRPPRGLAGVGLDQSAAVVQLDQFAVGAHVQLVAQVAAGHRIQGAGDLDVEVAVHLHGLEHGHVIGGRDGQQAGGLVGVEHLAGAGLQGAVDPHPGPLGAPHRGPLLGFLEAGEHLTGPEVAAHVLHRAFDLRLVLIIPNSG